MKSPIICLLFFVLFNTQNATAQNVKKVKDTVYYLLDTAAVPISDRMFEISEESGMKVYALQCRCYPWEMNPVFFSRPHKEGDTKYISQMDYQRLKKITLVQLVNIAFEFGKDKIDKTNFYFVEPSDDKFKVIKTYLIPSRKPRGKTITIENIKPSN